MLKFLRDQRRITCQPDPSTKIEQTKDKKPFIFKISDKNPSNYFEIPLELKQTYPNIPEGQTPPPPVVLQKKVVSTPAKPTPKKGPKPQSNYTEWISRGEMQMLARKKRQEVLKLKKAEKLGKKAQKIDKNKEASETQRQQQQRRKQEQDEDDDDKLD